MLSAPEDRIPEGWRDPERPVDEVGRAREYLSVFLPAHSENMTLPSVSE